MQTKLRWLISVSVLLGVCASSVTPMVANAANEDQAPGRKLAHQVLKDRQSWNTTDHRKHQVLWQDFKSGSEITAACLSCHTEAEEQFKQTIHWTWIDPNSADDTITGKAGHSVNNFCISTNKMKDGMCSSCHAGWDGKQDGVNCLVCHSQNLATLFNPDSEFADIQEALASYRDLAPDPDANAKAADIQKTIHEAVLAIGFPTRQSCGACHFYGGGGDGVKHGDLDSSLCEPSKELDVHMSAEGQNFLCTRCHTTRLHHVAGRIYATPASLQRSSLLQDDLTTKIMCESCHGERPHKTGRKINDHTDKVACQSCHIPFFARENPTKMWWDWSQAGKLKDGKPYHEDGNFGRHSYVSEKGEMRWEKNVKPEYSWFNGSIVTLTAKDVIETDKIVAVSRPLGDQDDEASRIFPFKIHRGKQPYDKVHKTLLTPLVSGPDGLWTTFDWDSAIAEGAEAIELPFSGEFGFVETTYAYPITHMVAPSTSALSCSECHRRNDGRLAQLAGIYIPGRDSNKWIEIGGWLLIIGSLAGVCLHAAGRVFFAGRKRG